MRNLDISQDLSLPPDVVTQTLIVYGGKGMGKTNLGSVLVEEMYKKNLRFSVIDPMGVWWGLQHGKRKGTPGLEVLILGGIHGDLPIEPTGGAVVADLVVDESVSVVIDISRTAARKAWSKGEKIRFVTEYMTRLYERQAEYRRPIMQIIDEAARYAPQVFRPGEVDVAKCLGIVETVVEEGRNLGIGLMLLTQRSARLSKSVAELADSMLAFRTIGPNSMASILDWLGSHVPRQQHKDFESQLRSLPVGSALVVSPGWLEFEGVVRIRERETFDSSATPKAGHELAPPGKPTKPDLAVYRERMAATIERAEAEDPRKQRKRVVELEREVDKLKGELQRAGEGSDGKPARQVIKKVPVLTDSQVERFEKLFERMRAETERYSSAMSVLWDNQREMAGVLGGAIMKAVSSPEPQFTTPIAPPRVAAPPRVERVSQPQPTTRTGDTNHQVSPVGQRMLNALAELEMLGIPEADRTQVAFFTGYTNLSSKGFVNALGTLSSSDLIRYPRSGAVALTEQGRVIASFPAAPRTTADLQDRIIRMLGGVHERLLRPLIDSYPKAMERVELARVAGYTNLSSKGFVNALGRMRSLGLVEYPAPGMVAAHAVLFLRAQRTTSGSP